MFGTALIKPAALAIAAIGFTLAGTDAFAGHDKDRGNNRDYRQNDRHSDRHDSRRHDGHRDRGHGHHDSHKHHKHHKHSGRRSVDSQFEAYYGNDSYRISVRIGDRDRRHYGNDRPGYHRSTRCDPPPVVCSTPQRSGYWSRVYRQPVYVTRYDSCGRSYRVCVRAGYYERVWVSTSRVCR